MAPDEIRNDEWKEEQNKGHDDRTAMYSNFKGGHCE